MANYLFNWHIAAIRHGMGIRTEFSGQTPNHAAFIFINHPSYFDVFYLVSRHPFSMVVAKEFKYWPFIGWLGMSMKTKFINRKDPELRHVIRKSCVEVYKENKSMIIAVEGKTAGSNATQPVKPGMFKEAVVNKIPVAFGGIYYRQPEATYFHDLSSTFVRDVFQHLWSNLKRRRTNVIVRYSEPQIFESVESGIRKFYDFLESQYGDKEDFAILDTRF